MLYEGLALADGNTASKTSTLKVIGAGVLSLAASIAAGLYTRKALKPKGATIANSAGVGVGLAVDVGISTLAAKTVLKDDYAALYADPSQKTAQQIANIGMPTYDRVRSMFGGNTDSLVAATPVTTGPPLPTAEQQAQLKATADAATKAAEAAKAEAAKAEAVAADMLKGIPGVSSNMMEMPGMLSDAGGGNATHL